MRRHTPTNVLATLILHPHPALQTARPLENSLQQRPPANGTTRATLRTTRPKRLVRRSLLLLPPPRRSGSAEEKTDTGRRLQERAKETPTLPSLCAAIQNSPTQTPRPAILFPLSISLVQPPNLPLQRTQQTRSPRQVRLLGESEPPRLESHLARSLKNAPRQIIQSTQD